MYLRPVYDDDDDESARVRVCVCVKTWTNVTYTTADALNCATTLKAHTAAVVTPASSSNQITQPAPVSVSSAY